ncbi:MAG: sodium:solute symporter family protein [FCB group bacterium]|jgi:SSS family solute:Na+ symporter|nr:sodium:solute symporter family protein [FCB group bacterium]
MNLLTIVIVIGYLLATAYLGFRGYKQTKTAADYMLAGRKAHPTIMALSYGATFISTSAIVGFGGAAANFGMGLLWLTVLNIFVGIFIAFVFLGGPTRRMGHHIDAHTFPEFLGKRFNSRLVHVSCGLIIFLFMPLYAMAVIKGGAEFISTAFNVTPDVALLIFALIVAAYVIPGGLKGVMLTDALQGGIMLVGMIVLVVTTYAMLGGVTEAHLTLAGMTERVPAPLTAMGHQGWTSMPKFGWAAPGMAPAEASQYNLWWILVSTIVMGVGIGVLAQPQLIVRFMTVKSQQSLNRAVPVGGIFILFMTGVAFVIGPLSNAYFHQKEVIECRILDEAVLMDPGADGKAKLSILEDGASEEAKARAKRFVAYRLPGEKDDQVPHYVLFTPAMKIERGAEGADKMRPGLIAIARSVDNETTMQGNVDRIIPNFVNSAMPKWFGVVFLLTLLSAAMSTLSSQFHTIGTAIGRDVVGQFVNKPEHTLFITRLGVGAGLIIAIVLGKMVGDNIIALATAVFFGLCASSFLPVFLAALFWRRMSRNAAMASILAGFCTSAFWLVFINAKTAGGLSICKWLFGTPTLLPASMSPTWAVVDPLFVALPVAAVVAVIAGLLTKPMDPAYADYCFGGELPGTIKPLATSTTNSGTPVTK